MADQNLPHELPHKNPKGKPVRSGQRLMAYNVYSANSANNISKSAAIQLTAKEVGLGEKLCWKIVREMESSGSVSSPRKTRRSKNKYEKLEEFEKSAIRRYVHSFFFKNELPTLAKVLQKVNEDESLPTMKRTTLWRVLRKLGFKYEKRTRKTVLIEKQEIILWRRRYLTSMKKFRDDGRKIYYTDETWVNAGHVKNRVWQDTTVKTARQALLEGVSTGIKDPSGKGKRLIITHMGSDTGFVEGAYLSFESKKTGDYHEEMNGTVYTEWLERVLPLLEDNCVIVMDNAPYHSMKTEKVPNQSWKKNDIIEWLESKLILTHGSLLKLELLQLVKEYALSNPTPYVIDEMVQNSGRTILRLPPYHCNFNPIELVWAQVKNYVAANNKTYKISDVKNLLDEGIQNVTGEKWKSCVNHIIAEEKRMWDLDGIAENMMEIIIQPDLDSSSSEDSSDEEMGVDNL